jgi:hypothetical protein
MDAQCDLNGRASVSCASPRAVTAKSMDQQPLSRQLIAMHNSWLHQIRVSSRNNDVNAPHTTAHPSGFHLHTFETDATLAAHGSRHLHAAPLEGIHNPGVAEDVRQGTHKPPANTRIPTGCTNGPGCNRLSGLQCRAPQNVSNLCATGLKWPLAMRTLSAIKIRLQITDTTQNHVHQHHYPPDPHLDHQETKRGLLHGKPSGT